MEASRLPHSIVVESPNIVEARKQVVGFFFFSSASLKALVGGLSSPKCNRNPDESRASLDRIWYFVEGVDGFAKIFTTKRHREFI